MGKEGFRELTVWQRAKNLAISVYKITTAGEFSRDFGLRDQVRRAVVSIASNIAEGDERDTDKDSVRFFFMAKGSLAELLTQIIIANEIGYLKEQDYKYISDECEILGKMLGKLIKARKGNGLSAMD